MKTQDHGAAVLALRWGEPVRLADRAGELAVLAGRIWLTRAGDPDDHVLTAGEGMRVERGNDVVVEAWRRGEGATVAWVC